MRREVALQQLLATLRFARVRFASGQVLTDRSCQRDGFAGHPFEDALELDLAPRVHSRGEVVFFHQVEELIDEFE